jgi:hypothetical protein
MTIFKFPRHGVPVPRRTSGGGYLISGKYLLSPTASYMKSEKKPCSFTLFLMVGATAKIFYSNAFWEPNEQSIAERVEEGKDWGYKELQLWMLRK